MRAPAGGPLIDEHPRLARNRDDCVDEQRAEAYKLYQIKRSQDIVREAIPVIKTAVLGVYVMFRVVLSLLVNYLQLQILEVDVEYN